MWWLDEAKWEPRFGWWPWLITFAVGCLLLAFNIIRDARVQPNPLLGETVTTGPDDPAIGAQLSGSDDADDSDSDKSVSTREKDGSDERAPGSIRRPATSVL